MNTNQDYIQTVRAEEIPWHRLTTAYGRATNFPEYFNVMWSMQDPDAVKTALDEIRMNTEHQSTLWHATPFAMIFLVRIFEHAIAEVEENAAACFLAEQLSDFFLAVAECVRDGNGMEHADPLPHFSDLLEEPYLWPEEYDEEEEELRWEEEPFPDDLFYSFWYYSEQVLFYGRPIFEKAEHPKLREKTNRLKELV